LGDQKNINFKIANISIKFICHENNQIIEFIKRDFGIFKFDSIDSPDLCIEITHNKFHVPKNCTYFDSTIISFENTIAVKYNARFRSAWVTFSTKPHLGNNIKIYIPKELMLTDNKSIVKEKIIRMFFPNFLYRWQNLLLDIIHGPLLGIIHLRLLRENSALIHASAITNKNGKGILIPGWAQSGKSTIVDILINKKSWKFIAEDLCILTKEKTLATYPKQRRIYWNQLKNTNYFKRNINFLEKIEDRINVLLLGTFKPIGFKSKRILSWDEIIEKKNIEEISDINAVVYLLRGDYDDISLLEVSNKKLAEMCSSMMLTELQNFNGFFQLIAVYGIVSDDVNPIETLSKNTYEMYLSTFKDKNCYILKVPYFDNLDFVENWIHPNFEDILINKIPLE
jgi:hypothetical protein